VTITTRLFLLAVALSLLGGGVILLGGESNQVPLLIGLATLPAVLGMVLGARRHPKLVVALVIVGLYSCFGYVLLLAWAAAHHVRRPGYGLLAGGGAMLALALVAETMTRAQLHHAWHPWHTRHTATSRTRVTRGPPAGRSSRRSTTHVD
jgi:hypothetical protein